jgi:hypothetical protein
VGGVAFLAVYAVGRLNGKFALWAGGLDCGVGFSALFAGRYLTPARTTRQRGLLVAWMALGIVDFPVAVLLARMARADDPASMVALTGLPLSLITTWGVPIALIAGNKLPHVLLPFVLFGSGYAFPLVTAAVAVGLSSVVRRKSPERPWRWFWIAWAGWWLLWTMSVVRLRLDVVATS